mgnify:CR=1 FL=1
MKTLHLDCFQVISGNMFVGMLIQAGVPFEPFKRPWLLCSLRAMNSCAAVKIRAAYRLFTIMCS